MSKKLPYIDVTYNGEVTTYNELLDNVTLFNNYANVETQTVLSHEDIHKVKLRVIEKTKFRNGSFNFKEIDDIEICGIDELNEVINFLTYVRDYKGEKK